MDFCHQSNSGENWPSSEHSCPTVQDFLLSTIFFADTSSMCPCMNSVVDPFVVENQNALEIQVQILSCELDNLPTERRNIEKENGVLQNSTIPVFLSPEILEGSRLSAFLSTFVQRTPKIGNFLVDLDLIQKFFSDLKSGWSNWSNQCTVTEKAARAYILAAVGIGSLHFDYFCSDSHERHYKAMKKSLRGCFGEENETVIFAHIAISLFCFITGRTKDFKLHSGFARILMKSCGENVKHVIKKSYAQVILVPDIAGLPGIEGIGLSIFCSRANLSPDDFQSKFPFLNSYMGNQLQLLNSGASCGYSQEITGIQELLISSDSRTFLNAIVSGSCRFVRQVVTTIKHLKSEKVKALTELVECLDLVVTLSNLNPKLLAPSIHWTISIIKMFRAFFSNDSLDAKEKLKTLVNMTDSFTLSSWLTYKGDYLHLLHLMVILMSYFEMDQEYYTLQKKINSLLALMLQPNWFCTLPPVTHHMVHSICQERCCSGAWVSL